MIATLDEIPRAAEPCDPALDWRPVRDHQHELAAGSLVLVAPGSTREAFATAPGTAVLVVGAAPGTPFAVSGWEARQLALSGRA